MADDLCDRIALRSGIQAMLKHGMRIGCVLEFDEYDTVLCPCAPMAPHYDDRTGCAHGKRGDGGSVAVVSGPFSAQCPDAHQCCRARLVSKDVQRRSWRISISILTGLSLDCTASTTP